MFGLGCASIGGPNAAAPSSSASSAPTPSPIPRDGAQELVFRGLLSGRMTSADPQLARCGKDLSGAYDLSLQGEVGGEMAQFLVAIPRYRGSGEYSDERVYAALWSPPNAHPDHVWHRRIGVDPAHFSVDPGERTGSTRMTLTSSSQTGETQVVVDGRWSCAVTAVITPDVPPDI